MSTKRTRKRFQPRVTRGTTAAAVNATFRDESHKWGLRWTCQHCVYLTPSDGQCSLHWPNEPLMARDPDVLDGDEVPIFCKAFEDNGHVAG